MAAPRLASLLLWATAFFAVTLAMDCNFGRSENIVDKVVHSCPRPLIDSTDNSFCCLNTDIDWYCCSGVTFGLQLALLLAIIIVPILIVCSLVCCICRSFC